MGDIRPIMSLEGANIGHFQARKSLGMVFILARITAVSFYSMKPIRIIWRIPESVVRFIYHM